jgi:hypothetical protein
MTIAVSIIDWEALRKPFPKEQIGKLPATSKRPALDYVGHAAVTDRLNRVCAGLWSYTIDELFSVEGTVWVRGTLTIGDVSRPEYGDGANPKEAVGNFLRRAAMRFGVALDLWSREELESSPAVSEPAAERDVASKGEAEPTSRGLAPTGVGRPQVSPAGDISSTEGEAVDTKPGEGQPKPCPGFINKASECSHRVQIDVTVMGGKPEYVDGDWAPTVQIRGQPRCSLCGTPAVKYMEAV